MIDKPLVSILVPIYGVESYIERCTRSLFGQTYNNCEFVFVNDCTKDNSIVILHDVIKEYPSIHNRIKIIEHEYNKGVDAARQTCLSACHGDFFLFVDPDDYIELKYVEKFVDVILQHDADLVIQNYKSDTSVCEIQGNIYEKKLLMRRTQTCVWGKLFKYEIVKMHNVDFLDGIDHAEDFSFMCRFVAFCTNIYGLKDNLYHYTTDNIVSYTNNYSEKSIKSIINSIMSVRLFLVKLDTSYIFATNLSALEFYKDSISRKLARREFLDNMFLKYLSELKLNWLQSITLYCIKHMPILFSKILIELQYRYMVC